MKKIKSIKSSYKNAVQIVIILALLGILAAIIWGISVVIRRAWGWILEVVYTVSTMDTVIIIALISGSVTILGLLVNSIISLRVKNSEFRYKRKAMLLRKLEAPYSQFVNMLFDMVQKKEDAGTIDEEVRARMIRDMSRVIILYGSDEVVKKWAKYRKISPNLSVEEHLLYIEGLLHLIRSDMGIKKGQLMAGDLLALFVNDFELNLGNHFNLTLGGLDLNLEFDSDSDTHADMAVDDTSADTGRSES